MTFESLNEFVDSSLDKLREEIDRRFEVILRQQLVAWEKRWPNHQFSAWQGHGMLSIEVSPTICGQSQINQTPNQFRIGAIAELCGEAEAFVSAHCGLEWKVSTSEFGPISSQEKAP